MRFFLKLFLLAISLVEVFLTTLVIRFRKIIHYAFRDEAMASISGTILFFYELLAVLTASQTSALQVILWASGPLLTLCALSLVAALYLSVMHLISEVKKITKNELERTDPSVGFRKAREYLTKLPNGEESQSLINALESNRAFCPDSPDKVLLLCQGIAYVHGKQEGLLLESGKLLSEAEKLNELLLFLNRNLSSKR